MKILYKSMSSDSFTIKLIRNTIRNKREVPRYLVCLIAEMGSAQIDENN